MKKIPHWAFLVLGAGIVGITAYFLNGIVSQPIFYVLFLLAFGLVWCGMWMFSNWIKTTSVSAAANDIARSVKAILILQLGAVILMVFISIIIGRLLFFGNT